MKHRKIKTKKILNILLFLIVFASPLFAAAMEYQPMEEIPGLGATSDWCVYVSYIYKFGLWAVGIAALLMVSIGGFMYISSAGNNASMEKAKGVLTDAVVGLVMALTAWLVLNTINPDLVNCALPDALDVEAMPAVSAPPPSPPADLPAAMTQPCAAPCELLPASMCTPNPCVGTGCRNCSVNSALATKLKSIGTSLGWKVTEAWPPVVPHMSTCHQVGTCVDIGMTGGASVANVKAFADALKAAGFTSFQYESAACGPFTAAGIKCATPKTMTGSHFHVNS